MTYRDVARKLKSCGCAFERQSKGSHEVWRSRVSGQRTTVPNWGSKDLAPGTISTISTIIRELNISKQDFDKS